MDDIHARRDQTRNGDNKTHSFRYKMCSEGSSWPTLLGSKKKKNTPERAVVWSARLFSPMVQVVAKPLLRCCGQFSFEEVIMQCERERFICNDSLTHEYSQSKQRKKENEKKKRFTTDNFARFPTFAVCFLL